MTIYHCSWCKQPIHRNEPVKMYSEDGHLWFFHNGDSPCFLRWKLERIRAEAERIERYLDSQQNGG